MTGSGSRGWSRATKRWESFALAMALVPSRMLPGGANSTVDF